MKKTIHIGDCFDCPFLTFASFGSVNREHTMCGHPLWTTHPEVEVAAHAIPESCPYREESSVLTYTIDPIPEE